MDNALIFTALLLLSALVGGLVGAACAKGRKTGDCEARLAELEDRLDALATNSMDEDRKLRERVDELTAIIGPDREDHRNVITTQIADLDIRADELHDHYTDVKRQLTEQNERLAECELLIGETPTGGLLGRVGALEDAARKGAQGER